MTFGNADFAFGICNQDELIHINSGASHTMPSKRGDGKNIAVCKFISRKTKYDILNAKKSARDFKIKDQSVFINEHLSPHNRNLFALAAQKKREYRYKYLWTKEGHVFMRKEERSPVLKISD